MEQSPFIAMTTLAAYFVWLAVQIASRWQQVAPSSRAGCRPGWVWCVCALPLCLLGFLLGHVGPIFIVFVNQRLAATVWNSAGLLLLAAVGTELGTTGMRRWWIRPAIWGLAIGAVSLLAHLVSIEWKIDLTI